MRNGRLFFSMILAMIIGAVVPFVFSGVVGVALATHFPCLWLEFLLGVFFSISSSTMVSINDLDHHLFEHALLGALASLPGVGLGVVLLLIL